MNSAKFSFYAPRNFSTLVSRFLGNKALSTLLAAWVPQVGPRLTLSCHSSKRTCAKGSPTLPFTDEDTYPKMERGFSRNLTRNIFGGKAKSYSTMTLKATAYGKNLPSQRKQKTNSAINYSSFIIHSFYKHLLMPTIFQVMCKALGILRIIIHHTVGPCVFKCTLTISVF